MERMACWRWVLSSAETEKDDGEKNYNFFKKIIFKL
jgi:hypothetical protein